jgi:hypothetical protein
LTSNGFNTPKVYANDFDSGLQDVGDGIAWLERQRGFCGQWDYMSRFVFYENGGRLKLTYRCTQYNNQVGYTVNDYYSGLNDNGGLNYLDRHSMNCPGNSALVGFEGQNVNGQFRLHYKCGVSNILSFPTQAPSTTSPSSSTPTSSKPTPAPVADSTSAPVADSTSAPVADSTSAPVADSTSAPVADTTSAPVADTTSAPVADSTSAPVVAHGSHNHVDEDEVSVTKVFSLPATQWDNSIDLSPGVVDRCTGSFPASNPLATYERVAIKAFFFGKGTNKIVAKLTGNLIYNY